VKMLLGAGTNIDALDEHYGSAVKGASNGDYEQAAKVPLEKDASASPC
jgi:hypothetical protein